MAEQEKEILLKTRLFGFDKKKTMDYIAKLKLENDGLKRQMHDLSLKQGALLRENDMFRNRYGIAEAGAEQSEDLPEAEEAYELPAIDEKTGLPPFVIPEGFGREQPDGDDSEPDADLDSEFDSALEVLFKTESGSESDSVPEPVEEPVKKVAVPARKKIIQKRDGKTYITSVK